MTDLKELFGEAPDFLSSEEQIAIAEWLGGLSNEKKRSFATVLLAENLQGNKALPVEIINKTVANEYVNLEEYLVKNLDHFTSDQTSDFRTDPEVSKFSFLIQKAQLSIMNAYLQEKYNKYRTLSFRRIGQSFETYINVAIDFTNQTIFGESSSSSIIRKISMTEIDDINWSTEAGEIQKLYCFVEQKRRSIDVLVFTIGKLITIRNLENYIKDLVENYSDIFNVDGLVKHAKIKKFEEWLTTAEKVGIPIIDDEIKKIYGRFIDLLEKKVGMLKERSANHSEKYKKDPIVEGGPAVHLHQEEVAGGYTFRYIRNNPNITRIELVAPNQLSDKEKKDPDRYFRIPYFSSPDREIEEVPFVLTEWHLSILVAKIAQLHDNPTTNSLLMGLAGTGKDYFIKWISYLMNVKQCSFDCRQVEEINDMFYTRRIKEGEDYYVPTDVYYAIKHSGCLIYLAEVNKLGEKFSDLNAMHDFKREVFIPVDGKIYKLPSGNLILASANPAWFGGGRGKLEPDVKDRYQNIIVYNYPPFFTQNTNQGKLKYYSHEAEIRYRMFPQLAKIDQLKIRALWKKLFNSGYKDGSDRTLFGEGKSHIKALVLLKRVLHFTNLYRKAYEDFRKARSDTVATEMITQRGVEEIISRIVAMDRSLSDFDVYKRVILEYMYERFEDADENIVTVREFLKD
ncbi:MAG: AAA family ATPase [Proteobacteria bacterium]|nr:AAA family ATPase [Pseudomonadota bacterium]